MDAEKLYSDFLRVTGFSDTWARLEKLYPPHAIIVELFEDEDVLMLTTRIPNAKVLRPNRVRGRLWSLDERDASITCRSIVITMQDVEDVNCRIYINLNLITADQLEQLQLFAVELAIVRGGSLE